MPKSPDRRELNQQNDEFKVNFFMTKLILYVLLVSGVGIAVGEAIAIVTGQNSSETNISTIILKDPNVMNPEAITQWIDVDNRLVMSWDNPEFQDHLGEAWLKDGEVKTHVLRLVPVVYQDQMAMAVFNPIESSLAVIPGSSRGGSMSPDGKYVWVTDDIDTSAVYQQTEDGWEFVRNAGRLAIVHEWSGSQELIAMTWNNFPYKVIEVATGEEFEFRHIFAGSLLNAKPLNNGSLIAIANRGETRDITIFHQDGTEELVVADVKPMGMSLSADEQFLLFHRDAETRQGFDVFVLDRQTGQEVNLGPLESADIVGDLVVYAVNQDDDTQNFKTFKLESLFG